MLNLNDYWPVNTNKHNSKNLVIHEHIIENVNTQEIYNRKWEDVWVLWNLCTDQRVDKVEKKKSKRTTSKKELVFIKL